MENILKVHSVNDYARYIGAPELHPLVAVIHYDELEHCRHSLNNYDVYGLFIGDEELEDLSYGQLQYDLHRHALMCVAPGQIGGKTDTGEEIHTKGWALLFDGELLNGTDVGRRMSSYTFFSYNISEALLMTDEQRHTIVTLFEALRAELSCHDDHHVHSIAVAYIGLILEHVSRFYALQLSSPAPATADLLSRFENLLKRYYAVRDCPPCDTVRKSCSCHPTISATLSNSSLATPPPMPSVASLCIAPVTSSSAATP